MKEEGCVKIVLWGQEAHCGDLVVPCLAFLSDCLLASALFTKWMVSLFPGIWSQWWQWALGQRQPQHDPPVPPTYSCSLTGKWQAKVPDRLWRCLHITPPAVEGGYRSHYLTQEKWFTPSPGSHVPMWPETLWIQANHRTRTWTLWSHSCFIRRPFSKCPYLLTCPGTFSAFIIWSANSPDNF